MLHNTLEHQNLEALSISLEAAKKLGDEYGRLMVTPNLTAEQEARIDEILLLATIHGNVDFWVARAACDRGAEAGLLSPEYLSYYEDQRAILREQVQLDTSADSEVELTLLAQVKAARAASDKAIEKLANEMDNLDKGKASASGSK